MAMGRSMPLAGRVRLRDVTEGDLPIFFEHQREPDANRMASFPARDRGAFMAHWSRIMTDPAVLVQTILADEQVAGNVVSWESGGRRLVGYWIGRGWWGRGVATDGLTAFVERVPARPLYARVAKDNISSIRVLEKCGFALCAELTETLPAPTDGVEELIFVLGALGRESGDRSWHPAAPDAAPDRGGTTATQGS